MRLERVARFLAAPPGLDLHAHRRAGTAGRVEFPDEPAGDEQERQDQERQHEHDRERPAPAANPFGMPLPPGRQRLRFGPRVLIARRLHWGSTAGAASLAGIAC